MYRYLLDHPEILPCKVKEPQFFSKSGWHRWRHYSDYLALFPEKDSQEDITLNWYILNDAGRVEVTEVCYERGTPGVEITGEASANTFFDVPPQRLLKYFPGARAILMLRDPVERAWSHYRMFERFSNEGRRLPFRLSNFRDDSVNEIDRYRRGKRTYFVGQGVYADNLPHWSKAFGDRLHVLFADSLRDHRNEVMRNVTAFLELPQYDYSSILKEDFNVASKVEADPEARAILSAFYKPYNDKLAQLLKRDLPWG